VRQSVLRYRVGRPGWGRYASSREASWDWPNWRDLESEELREQVEWPTRCVLSVIRGGGWPTGWDRRPTNPDEVEAKTHRLLATVPRMVPVYAHRYLPAGRATSGHAVLSIHALDDIIVYGLDLADYVDQEFRSPTITVRFWSAYL
jgi:hypothetical protein